MTAEFELSDSIHHKSIGQRALQGAGIASALIVVFLLIGGETNPGAPKMWWLLVIFMVPLAGGIGGSFYYLMDHLRCRGGWKKFLANIISLLVYFFMLLAGFVLGMNGPN